MCFKLIFSLAVFVFVIISVLDCVLMVVICFFLNGLVSLAKEVMMITFKLL